MKYFAILLLFVPSIAFADQLNIDRVPGTFSGGGGEFNTTPLGQLDYSGGVPALNNTSFQSFCLEKGETISIGGTYDYVVNTGAVLGGVGGFDPLSPITAWMYENFVEGTLLGYDYGPIRAVSAGALQNAIWYSEGEGSLAAGLATDFYNQALAAAPTGIGCVRVLNLFQNGQYRQDQIFMHECPEPSTLVLVLVCVGVCFVISYAFRPKVER